MKAAGGLVDAFLLESATVAFADANRGLVIGVDGEQRRFEAESARFSQREGENLRAVGLAALRGFDVVADVAAVVEQEVVEAVAEPADPTTVPLSSRSQNVVKGTQLARRLRPADQAMRLRRNASIVITPAATSSSSRKPR